MLGNLLLLVLTVSPGAAGAGQVMATTGPLTVDRGGRAYRAAPGAVLATGDRLATPPRGGASLFLYDGHSVYLGPAASLTLEGGPGNWSLDLARGEARVTTQGRGGVRIATRLGWARVDRGTLRAAAAGRDARFWTERGTVDVSATAGTALRLKPGQQVVIPQDGAPKGPKPARVEDWSIRVDAIQLAGAAACSRRLKCRQAREANEATALAFRDRFGPAPEPPGAEPRGAEQPPAPEPPSGERPAAAQPAAAAEPAPASTAASQSTTATESTSTSAIALALGNVSASSSAGTSGGLFSDAQQDTRNLAFPGNIHLITAQTSYLLRQAVLRPSDAFPVTREFWSIGLGPRPAGQVVTDFRTGTNPTPTTIPIPRFHAYLVRLDQFGVADPAATNPAPERYRTGMTGLVGQVPVSPQIRGAIPLRDPRARFNDRATFALGEFALERHGNHPQIDLRRSDQDRQIIKGPFGNDDQDRVTPNPDVQFTDTADPKFFPEVPKVKVPVSGTMRNRPTFGRLDPLRKAGATTLLADRLSGLIRRTGQTRFVLDGSVVDVSGFRRR